IATVRLDFPGCGNSTEPFTAYTLSNMTDDIESAITYMQQTYGTGRTALVGHSMGGRLASLYPQRRGGITALALWSPANGAGLRGMEFLNIDDFSAVEALAAEAEASGSISTWGVDVSGALFTEMRDSDPNAALRESALPTLLTYTGHEGILSDTTQAETIAAVESLPDGRVVLEPFAEGNHNYLSEDAATAAALDKALRETTVAFLVEYLK
ncbi:MAG: alpha/beta fold hydrolase, partial [Subdoligranulum sp.]|nr:alpha/beta fold hydrolase [Subdoligranulum sp.]